MSATGTNPPETPKDAPKTIAVPPSRGEVVRRDFTGEQLERTAETAVTAMAAQATAAVQARHIMAMKNPRDLFVVRGKLLKDCSRPGFAEVAIYHKPIGDGIEGPSIRLAEAAARAMTNIHSSVMAIYDDPGKRIVRVAVTDLESNLTYEKDVSVPKTLERSKLRSGQVAIRQRTNSNGKTTYLIQAETDDDILNTENALVSKALRVGFLRLIPGDILEEAMNEARATLEKGIKDDPDKALRSMCDVFELQLGINPAQLAEYLGHPLPQTTIAEIGVMRKLFAAIKDGEATWAEAMENRGVVPEAKKPDPGKANLTDVAAASKAAREGTPATPTPGAAAPAATPSDPPASTGPAWASPPMGTTPAPGVQRRREPPPAKTIKVEGEDGHQISLPTSAAKPEREPVDDDDDRGATDPLRDDPNWQPPSDGDLFGGKK